MHDLRIGFHVSTLCYSGDTVPTDDGGVFKTQMGVFLYVLCQVVLPIVLLNLVIAKISGTYEDTMQRMEILKWKGKAAIVINIDVSERVCDCVARWVCKFPARSVSKLPDGENTGTWLHVLKPKGRAPTKAGDELNEMVAEQGQQRDTLKRHGEVLERIHALLQQQAQAGAGAGAGTGAEAGAGAEATPPTRRQLAGL